MTWLDRVRRQSLKICWKRKEKRRLFAKGARWKQSVAILCHRPQHIELTLSAFQSRDSKSKICKSLKNRVYFAPPVT
jgi:hypothetical protein